MYLRLLEIQSTTLCSTACYTEREKTNVNYFKLADYVAQN